MLENTIAVTPQIHNTITGENNTIFMAVLTIHWSGRLSYRCLCRLRPGEANESFSRRRSKGTSCVKGASKRLRRGSAMAANMVASFGSCVGTWWERRQRLRASERWAPCTPDKNNLRRRRNVRRAKNVLGNPLYPRMIQSIESCMSSELLFPQQTPPECVRKWEAKSHHHPIVPSTDQDPTTTNNNTSHYLHTQYTNHVITLLGPLSHVSSSNSRSTTLVHQPFGSPRRTPHDL